MTDAKTSRRGRNLRQLTRSGITYTYQYDDTGSRRLQKMHLHGQPSAEALGYLYGARGNVTQRRPGGFNRPAHGFIVDKANRTTQLRAIGSSQP